MTKEELMQLPVEELAEKVIRLEKSLKEKGEAVVYWADKSNDIQAKLDRYKDAIKSVVLYID